MMAAGQLPDPIPAAELVTEPELFSLPALVTFPAGALLFDDEVTQDETGELVPVVRVSLLTDDGISLGAIALDLANLMGLHQALFGAMLAMGHDEDGGAHVRPS